MGEEIVFENGRNSDFQGLVTLILDWVILHTVMHHSSTATYKPNFIEIEEIICGPTDVRTNGRTDGRTFETGFISSILSKNRSHNTQLFSGSNSSIALLTRSTTCPATLYNLGMGNCLCIAAPLVLEPMVLQRKLRPSIARANGQLEP